MNYNIMGYYLGDWLADTSNGSVVGQVAQCATSSGGTGGAHERLCWHTRVFIDRWLKITQEGTRREESEGKRG